MSDLGEKVEKSIKRIKNFKPKDGSGYYLAFSGGKDSVVCKALLDMAGVKYDATYRVTSVDPPELVRFIRDKHPDVVREVPRYGSRRGPEWEGKPITMWNIIPWKMMPPTRLVRYCCDLLKESGGDGRLIVTGVRWAESINRERNQGIVTVMGRSAGREFANDPNFRQTDRGGVTLNNDNTETRRIIEHCYKRHKTALNPIIEWTDEDVWAFIKANGIAYCDLYEEGFTRLGCVGCPMACKHGREKEFARWPKFLSAYMHAFTAMLAERRISGKTNGTWAHAEARDVFNWWMEYDVLPGQFTFDDYEEPENV